MGQCAPQVSQAGAPMSGTNRFHHQAKLKALLRSFQRVAQADVVQKLSARNGRENHRVTHSYCTQYGLSELYY